MKTTNSKLIITILFAAACLALFGVNAAFADHGDDDIQGEESFEFHAMMTPTAAAAPNSSIRVELEAEDNHGSATAQLEFEARHLLPGTYAIQTTLRDGSTVSLGSFFASSEGEAEIRFGEEGGPFPPNFSPFDVAIISVLNSNSVVIFTLDLSELGAMAGMTRVLTVDALPGPTVPNAAGTVMLNAFVSGGRARGTLQLSGHGLPAKLQMTVMVNGIVANVKKAKSTNAGNVTVRITPKGRTSTIAPGVNLFQANSLRLTDRFGNVILSANF